MAQPVDGEDTLVVKRVSALLIATLMMLSAAGWALAQSSAAPQPTDAPPTAGTPQTAVTPAQPVMPPASRGSGKATGLRHMGGEVVSVNAEGRTMTVKHIGKKKTKQLTFTLTGDAAAHATDFKPGDSVRVGYAGDMWALVAQTVTHKRRAPKK
jgi:hypothetical protein